MTNSRRVAYEPPKIRYRTAEEQAMNRGPALVVQFVNESRFANCEFANLFLDFDELQFG